MFLRTIAVATVLVLAACSPKPTETPAAASSSTSYDYSYDIALHVTPEAAARVKTLTVSAKYYGLPQPETAHLATAAGVIEFNTDTVKVEAKDQTVHMTGAGVPLDRVKEIIAGAALVQVTVTAPGIGCNVFQDYVKTAQEKPVRIYCSPAS